MIPVFDIKRQNKLLGVEFRKAIFQVVDKGNYILGEFVSEFEKAFARYIGVKYAVGVASGTDALSIALLAFGIKHGDGVILPANSYPSVFAVTAIGALPQLVDIDPQTYNIDPLKIPRAITAKTKAIMPVHLYGQPADMERIFPIGKEYKIPVIEDCAQAAGAEIKINQSTNQQINKSSNKLRSDKDTSDGGLERAKRVEWDSSEVEESRSRLWKKVGSLGDLGCFSFYPTKNLGCFGDGGMVVTNNQELAERVRMLRMYGEKERYKSIMLGRNSRLDEIQAAILLVKLKYLDKWNKKRREIAKEYELRIMNYELRIKLPNEMINTKHVYHLYVIRTNKRDQLKAYLANKGIQTSIHFPTPIHLVPSMRYLGYKIGDFPESEKASREILSLPMFPELRLEEVEKIVLEIKHFNYLNN